MSSPHANMVNAVPPLRVEDAFEVTRRAATAVLRRFRERVGTWPDLRLPRDLEVLGPLLDVRGVLQLHPGLTGYDVAYGLLRCLLESASYSPLADVRAVTAAALADGLIGRVYYNPPAREYRFRRQQLDTLRAGWEESRVTALVEQLADHLGNVNQTVGSAIEHQEVFRKQLVDWFSNPYLWLESRLREYCLKGGQGLVGLCAYYERLTESTEASSAWYS